MITYELAKQLKDAGFPVKEAETLEEIDKSYDGWLIPSTLSELIEACKNIYPKWWYEASHNPISNKWLVRFAKYPSSNQQHLIDNKIALGIGDSYEEAVAKLWLELNKKKFNCDICEDKGLIEKTEWTGEDQSYDITVRCECTYE